MAIKYLQHDLNARNDQKIAEMRVQFGYEGYGLYWAVLEVMADSSDCSIDSLAIAGLSLVLNHPTDDLEHFLDYCFRLTLFEKEENGDYYSPRLREWHNERRENVEMFREYGRLGAKKRWDKEREVNSPDIAPPLAPNGNRIEKKGKEDNTKEVNKKKKVSVMEFAYEVELPFLINSPNAKRAWMEWLNYRREIKKPYRSKKSVSSQLEAFNNSAQFITAIETSIRQGWQGLFPENNHKPQKKTNYDYYKEAYKKQGELDDDKKRDDSDPGPNLIDMEPF